MGTSPQKSGASAAIQIDSICNEFEAHFGGPGHLSIEDCLQRSEAVHHEALLRKLLQCEFTLLRREGQTLAVEDYIGRFPGHLNLIEELFLDAPAADYSTPHVDPRVDEETIVSAISGDPSMAAPAAGDSRYDFVREVARGGMGVILQTRDQQLRREIACKVLLPEHAGSAELTQRFVEEAQIAGQLQHPGIVPVYDVGRLTDERPYFTMRLVKGRTLAAILRERQSPAEERSRCLGIFEQVCQAMAYAHARGVIHRDLKPSNVMVGRFGEVQVMDWGLAKVLGDRSGNATEARPVPPTDVSIIETPRARDSDSGSGTGAETSAGSILGTVAYMAPEQARGDTELLDKWTDVFGLGAVLCEILTGQPLYTGHDRKQLHHRAACGDLRDALERLDACGADSELVSLAKRCLAVAPAERPADAGEVAQAVREHLDSIQERLRRAQIDQAAAEARAQEAKVTAAAERRAKRLTGGLCAAGLLLVVLGVATWRWHDQVRIAREANLAAHVAEVQQRDQRAALILQESITLQGQEEWAAALASARRAVDLVDDETDADLRQRISRQATDLQLLESLEQARIDSLGVDVKASQISHEGLPEKFAAAFRDAGLELHARGPDQAAALLERSSIRDRLVAALWFWANTDRSAETQEGLYTILKTVDQTSPARRVVDALDAGDDTALRALVDETDYANVPADMAWVVSAFLSRKDRNLSRDWLRQAQRVHPSDFWINFNLGHHLLRAGALPEAIGYFRVALAAHPHHAGVMINLAVSHLKQEAFPEAELFYREAIRAQPDYAAAQFGLGNALRFQDRQEAAVDAYHAALALLGENHNSVWASACIGLAESLHVLGDPAAIELLQQVLTEYPRLSEAWLVMARIHYNAEQWAECEACFRKALAINSQDSQAQSGLAGVLLAQKRYADAEAAFRVARELLGTDRSPAWDYATLGLAEALTAQGKEAEAVRLTGELGSPTSVALRETFLEVAKDHVQNNRWRDAENCYRQYLTLDPDNIQVHIDLARALSSQVRRPDAAEEYQAALQLLGSDRGSLWQTATLGLATMQSLMGDYAGAIELLEPLLEVNSRHLAALHRLGDTYRRQRDWNAAAETFRAMLEIAPGVSGPHFDLASTLLAQERHAEAEAEYRRGMELLEDRGTISWERACVGLAVAIAGQGRPEQALEELTRLAADAAAEDRRQTMFIQYHASRRDWTAVGRSYLSAYVAASDEYASVHAMRAAAAFLRGGDVSGYRETCATMLRAYAETMNPADADRTVKACCLSRHFDGDLLSVQKLAEVAVDGQERHSWYVYFALARGLAALRAGAWDDALHWSGVSRRRAPTFVQTAGPDFLIDAQAQQRLGHAEESRQALAEAVALRDAHAAEAEDPFDTTWGDWLVFDALRADIESMLAE